MNLVEKGSKTAKDGFKNEYFVIDKLNNWKFDSNAQSWLKIMGYNLSNIESVEARKIVGSFKGDVQAKIKIYLKELIEEQNISVKLISNENGFNQVDKRYVDKYKNLWNIPEDILMILKEFTGEIKNSNNNFLRDQRRMFFDEMKIDDRRKIINFFEKNKTIIISDILKGRSKFSAEWMLVIKKTNGFNDYIDWSVHPINAVINYFSMGEIEITKKGNLRIGKVTMQRKGGDNGRKSANMLQFKINPNLLFEI